MPHYEITVRGVIDRATAEAELGVSCRAEDGATFLAADLADDAALHGMLGRLQLLGLELVALERRS